MLTTSQLILQNLIQNENFHKRVIPFLKDEYFELPSEKAFFKTVKDYSEKYYNVPTFEAVFIELSKNKSVSEKTAEDLDGLFKDLKSSVENNDPEWLVSTTEEYCKDKALTNAIMNSISIIEGEDKQRDRGAIPDLLKEALSIEFDASLGHHHFDNADSRWEYYHQKHERLPFNLDYMNKITKGGFAKKTLNLILAGTHAGKSAMMVHQSAYNLMEGKNVVYFTLEMSEEEISKRIDANLMGIAIDDILTLPKDVYLNKVARLKTKALGQLIVKEFPTGAANVGNFRYFLNELRLKKNFFPDIIYVDYLNLCSSLRLKGSTNVNSYTMMKAISEELRGLAVEMNICVVTASQFNRGGAANSDPSMDDISESFAVNFGSDFIIALIATDELKNQNKVLIKQLKNRYADMNGIPKFFLGFDRAKMKFYDVDNPTSGIVSENSNSDVSYKDIPVFDTGSFNSSQGSMKTLSEFNF